MRDLCVVHIGMHKTGSSSIQSMLYNQLNDDNFHFTKLGGANQSAQIFSLFADHPEKYHGHVARGWMEDEVQRYNEQNLKMLVNGFKSKSKSIVEIISGEDIGYFNFDELCRLNDFIKIYFRSVKIIAYIRPPASYIQSAFQELVKHGLNRFDLSGCNPNYTRFKMFDTVFGRDNIIIRPFVSGQLLGGDIVKDFAHTLGVSLDEKNITIKDNESISRDALGLLYVYQKYTNGFARSSNIFFERSKLIEALSKIGSSRLKFSSSVIDPIIAQNKEGIKYIDQFIPGSLREEIAVSDSSISCEGDLMTFSNETIIALNGLIGKISFDDKVNYLPNEVAELVEILKNSLDCEIKAKAKINDFYKLSDLTESERNEYLKLTVLNINMVDYFVNNNIASCSGDALVHYIKNWRNQDLVIKGVFDTKFYLTKYPDIKKSMMNPLLHYFMHGISEGRIGFQNATVKT